MMLWGAIVHVANLYECVMVLSDKECPPSINTCIERSRLKSGNVLIMRMCAWLLKSLVDDELMMKDGGAERRYP